MDSVPIQSIQAMAFPGSLFFPYSVLERLINYSNHLDVLFRVARRSTWTHMGVHFPGCASSGVLGFLYSTYQLHAPYELKALWGPS